MHVICSATVSAWESGTISNEPFLEQLNARQLTRSEEHAQMMHSTGHAVPGNIACAPTRVARTDSHGSALDSRLVKFEQGATFAPIVYSHFHGHVINSPVIAGPLVERINLP